MRKVPDINRLDMAFGNIKHLPPMSEIPKRFSICSNTFQNKFVSKWFFGGLKDEDLALLVPKSGVDKNKALAAIAAILRSFEPKHEHKEAGAAFLLSEWFEDPSAPEQGKAGLQPTTAAGCQA